MSANSFLAGTTPAASGYRVLGVLNSPIFSKTLIHRFYCSTVSGNITDQSFIPKELYQCGDTVIWRRDPKPEIFDYVKNQDLDVSELNSQPVEMHVNRAKYWNLKLDEVDLKQVCNIKEWVGRFQENAVTELGLQIDQEILCHIPASADCFNKGANAGKRTRSYNLGYMGAPVNFNANSIMTLLSRATGTLMEQCASGEAYIVLPLEAKAIFMNNPLLQSVCMTGLNNSIVLNGSIPKSLMGINVFFSANLCRHREGTGIAYSIPFGYKTATAMITQLTKREHITQDPRSFSEYWRGLQLYDFKVIRPELVGSMYATFTVS
jgi:hypothetical protein